MVEQDQSEQSPVDNILIEFGTRLNEIEEKQRLIRDRVLLVGENLISSKEEQDQEVLDIKNKINNIETEIHSLKQINRRIISELGELARKAEMEILKKQMKMFQPLSYARRSDLEYYKSDPEKENFKRESVNIQRIVNKILKDREEIPQESLENLKAEVKEFIKEVKQERKEEKKKIEDLINKLNLNKKKDLKDIIGTLDKEKKEISSIKEKISKERKVEKEDLKELKNELKDKGKKLKKIKGDLEHKINIKNKKS